MTDNGIQPAEAAEENGMEEMSFAELFEQEDNNTVINVGEVAIGTVVDMNSDALLIDVGDKAESYIAMSEFRHEDPEREINIGDQFEVFIEKRKEEGGLLLSREKAIAIKVWEQIAKIQEEDGTIEGRIDNRVKGGMSVDIGVPAFLPYSQIDLRPVKDLDGLIGQTFDFKILKFNRKRNNVVISRRVILEEKRAELREQMRSTLEEGQTISGAITNITDYGLFIDLGGMDGLCHITDLSWGRVSHPSKLYTVGEEIEVKILKYDKDSDRVSLGVKQLKSDPWELVPETYAPGSRVAGKVVSITDYGVFVELEEGVEGMVHVSEMAWGKKLRHPSKIVDLGEAVEVEIIGVDAEKKRISLSMKQLEKDPWEVVEEKYPVGTKIAGRIKTVTNFGIFIGLGEGVDGLVHVSDMSWTKKVRNPEDIYKKGQEIEAVVLKIDRENERFSLGIKQLLTNPWDTIEERFPVGSTVQGTVTNLTDFGAFVDIGEDLEGLIHISELSDTKVNKVSDVLSAGDHVEVMVINLNKLEKKIGLSLRAKQAQENKDEYSQVTAAKETSSSNFGALLQEKLDEKAAASDISVAE